MTNEIQVCVFDIRVDVIVVVVFVVGNEFVVIHVDVERSDKL